MGSIDISLTMGLGDYLDVGVYGVWRGQHLTLTTRYVYLGVVVILLRDLIINYFVIFILVIGRQGLLGCCDCCVGFGLCANIGYL